MALVTDEKRSLFQTYAAEFETKYLLEPTGQQHIAAYKKEAEEVIRYWSEIKKAKQEGKRITDLVLEKLLPYSNTRHNREKGYRISITPAITKDLKKWFESAGWQQHDNWDNVANAIYELVYGLVEEHDWSCLKRFEANESVSRGIKAGFITPTLHFLDARYRIITGKTIDTVNHLLGATTIGRDLSNYREHLEIINQALAQLQIPLFEDADTFDAFCHWMCDKRLGGYARYEGPVGPEENEGSREGEDGGPTRLEEDVEPRNHWEAVYYLIKIGNLLGYKTYASDPTRIAFGKKLGDLAALTEVPIILKSAPGISRVDVIWFRPTPPFFFFEVEDGGTMRDALLRLYNAIAFDARFFIVSPVGNRSKFQNWVATEPFREYEERYNFRTYPEVFEFYKEVVEFIAMRERFLRL